jgi:DNA polymerase III epsilon subunit-like protein
MAPPDLRAYVSVDIETSGPSPSLHALLAIGACSVADLSRTFYVEVKPTSPRVEAEAMAVHGLSLEELSRSGLDRPEAMRRFEAWTLALVPAGAAPVFVSYNAPFDWMFINDAFHGTLGRNPFGHAALDIRALYMGQSGEPWETIRLNDLLDRHLRGRRLSHNALEDARDQAALLRALLGVDPVDGPDRQARC